MAGGEAGCEQNLGKRGRGWHVADRMPASGESSATRLCICSSSPRDAAILSPFKSLPAMPSIRRVALISLSAHFSSFSSSPPAFPDPSRCRRPTLQRAKPCPTRVPTSSA